MNPQRKLGETMHLVFKEAVVLKGPKPQYQNFTSHLLLLYKLFKLFQKQWGEAVI